MTDREFNRLRRRPRLNRVLVWAIPLIIGMAIVAYVAVEIAFWSVTLLSLAFILPTLGRRR